MNASISNINEVNFTQHLFEFVRFYKNHQKLNEEIAGLRERRFYEFGREKTVLIKRENFWMGIKTLQAFIIDNVHYIKRYSDVNRILKDFEKLELDFTSDQTYISFVDRSNKDVNLTTNDDIDFNIRYLKYLVRCFQLSYRLNLLLQTTLMINIKNKKDLIFRDERQFFESLAYYRNYLVDDLSNYMVMNTIEHFKRVLGYYYTYKVLFLSDETILMDNLILTLYDIITDEEGIKIIKESRHLTKSNSPKVKKFGIDIKYALCKIYAQTNSFLSERNILPKRKQKQNMDFTLI